jgi:hypothetical protein
VSKLSNGLRSLNVPVTQTELDEARELVRMLALQTTEKHKAWIEASAEETRARTNLSRLNSAVKRSGMAK